LIGILEVIHNPKRLPNFTHKTRQLWSADQWNTKTRLFRLQQVLYKLNPLCKCS